MYFTVPDHILPTTDADIEKKKVSEIKIKIENG